MSRAGGLRLVLLLLLIRKVCGHGVAYDYGFQVEKVLKHQKTNTFRAQVGARSAGALPLRQDVRQLEQDPYAWNIYILALSMMQFTSQDNLLSWYSACGIHGVPFVTWDGVNPTPGNENTGYCTHSSILFPTWHRAYLALFEQILANYARNIASWFPDNENKAGYVNAAAAFRIPYWDWAAVLPAGESILPDSLQSPTIVVSGPNGVQNISHPLYSYTFKPLNGSIFIEPPWSTYPETVRAPTPQNAQAQSNNTLVAQTLDANAQSFRSRLYNLFSGVSNFGEFSNEAWGNGNGSYDSLEAIHDTVHTLTGLQGHMAYVPFSAFDPIFWLHHAMLDRAFAMWQELWPGSWITPTAAVMASYTISVGQMVDSQTALTPFYSGPNGSFWNSDMVRNISVFAYSYPEMPGFGVPNRRAQVARAINRLYGSASLATHARKHSTVKKYLDGKVSEGVKSSGRSYLQQDGDESAEPNAAISRIVTNNKYQEWVANVRVRKQALNESFFIHFYVDDTFSDWSSETQGRKLVGTMGVFASPPAFGNNLPNHQASGAVPLTNALVDSVRSGVLQDLSVHSVKPFLLGRLRVEAARTDGSPVAPGEVPSLSVGIASSLVTVSNGDDDLPRWGPRIHQFDFI